MAANKRRWRAVVAAASGIVVIPLAARTLAARLFPEPIVIDPAVAVRSTDRFSVAGRLPGEDEAPLGALGLLHETASSTSWHWPLSNRRGLGGSSTPTDTSVRAAVFDTFQDNGCCPCPCGPGGDVGAGGYSGWRDPMAPGFRGGLFDPPLGIGGAGFAAGITSGNGKSAALAFGTLAAVATGLALTQGGGNGSGAPTVTPPSPPPEPVVVSP